MMAMSGGGLVMAAIGNVGGLGQRHFSKPFAVILSVLGWLIFGISFVSSVILVAPAIITYSLESNNLVGNTIVVLLTSAPLVVLIAFAVWLLIRYLNKRFQPPIDPRFLQLEIDIRKREMELREKIDENRKYNHEVNMKVLELIGQLTDKFTDTDKTA